MTRLIALVLPVLLTACGPAFDRADLLEAAPETARAALREADRHILVVRHARKVSEDCNALDCQLSETGEAMVERLSALLGEEPVDTALASAACRTVYTAMAGGVTVIQHQPALGLDVGCEIEDAVIKTRAIAMLEAIESSDRWTLVSEHSNTVCLWVDAMTPDAASPCTDSRIPSERYGDIFWLHRVDGDWQLVVVDAAFDVSTASETAE